MGGGLGKSGESSWQAGCGLHVIQKGGPASRRARGLRSMPPPILWRPRVTGGRSAHMSGAEVSRGLGGAVMASQTAAALKRAIRSVAKADQPDVTDRDLLRRFVEHDDQAAFASVVDRHGGMVLGVCRRTLPTLQDAEDAVQATFLLLSRK